MKIIFFTDNFPPRLGGVATYSWELPYHLQQLYPELSVTVYAFGSQSGQEVIGGLSIVKFKKKSLLANGWRVWQIIRQEKPQVVQATTFFPLGFFVALAARIFKIKSALTVYGTEVVTQQGSFLTCVIKALALRLAGAVLPFSESTSILMQKNYRLNKEKITVIRPCITALMAASSYDVRQKFGLVDDDFVVLFVGRLVVRKGVLDLVKAVELIRDPKVKLLIVGDGELNEELKEYIKQHHLSSKIFLVGSVPYGEILNYYQAAQVFSMPSFFDNSMGDIEGLGIVYLEAQSCGLPVIGTNSGGIPEAIAPNETGFIIESHDIQTLAEKIKLLKSNRELSEQMSQAAKKFVQERFNWQVNIQQHLKIYLN